MKQSTEKRTQGRLLNSSSNVNRIKIQSESFEILNVARYFTLSADHFMFVGELWMPPLLLVQLHPLLTFSRLNLLVLVAISLFLSLYPVPPREIVQYLTKLLGTHAQILLLGVCSRFVLVLPFAGGSETLLVGGSGLGQHLRMGWSGGVL
jgi:hypothetical protein